MDEERTKGVMDLVRSAFGADLKETQKMEKSLQVTRDTIMTNLSIISGTIAAGSLVLLSSGVSANAPYVVAGIIVLLINVLVVFGFQFYYHKRYIQNLNDFRQRKLSPVAELLLLYAEYQKGKTTAEEVDKKIAEVALKLHEYEIENNLRVINLENNNPNNNNWNVVFMSIITLAFLCIVWGLISPYLIMNNKRDVNEHQLHRTYLRELR